MVTIPPERGLGVKDVQESLFSPPFNDIQPYGSPDGPAPVLDDSLEPIPIENLPTPPPSKKHISEADGFVRAWLKRSAEYIATKADTYKLLEDLYWNRRKLSEWNKAREETKYFISSRGLPIESSEDEPVSWRADNTISVSPSVDAYAQQMCRSIFSSEDYFLVDPRPNTSNSIEDPRYPTSKKIQAKLIDTANDLQFRTRTYESLKDGAIYGTAVGKVLWLEDRGQPKPYFDPVASLITTKPTIFRQGPSLESINLLRFLPDPFATSGDVQKWSGIGDRTFVQYATLKQRFEDGGPYNVNKKQFFETWEEGQSLSSEAKSTIKDDSDAYAEPSPDTYLQVWEWHGRIHFSDNTGPTECVCTFVTDVNTDDPSSGVLVRLRETPIMKELGRRPYIVFQFEPCSSSLGIGIIEPNLDLVWMISHLTNLFADSVRLLSVPMGKAHYLSPMWDDIESDEDGNKVFPGRWFRYKDSPDEIQPFSFQGVDLHALSTLIQYLERQWEKRTTVTDSTRAISETRKTATEFHGLEEAHKEPIQTRLSLFRENFLEPFGKIALGYFAQRIEEDQIVWGKSQNGTPIPVTLTTDELRTGEYVVRAAMDTTGSAKISKAQSIVQVLPILENMAFPLLAYESVRYSRKKLIDELVKLLDVDDPDSVLQEVPEEERIKELMLMQNRGMPMSVGMGMGGQPNPPGPPGMNGGPMGPNPNTMNDMTGQQQREGTSYAPVHPGYGPA